MNEKKFTTEITLPNGEKYRMLITVQPNIDDCELERQAMYFADQVSRYIKQFLTRGE